MVNSPGKNFSHDNKENRGKRVILFQPLGSFKKNSAIAIYKNREKLMLQSILNEMDKIRTKAKEIIDTIKKTPRDSMKSFSRVNLINQIITSHFPVYRTNKFRSNQSITSGLSTSCICLFLNEYISQF